MYRDVEIVYDIFSQSTWENVYHFKSEISKIKDKKFALGLLIEFIRTDFEYDISQEDVIDIISDTVCTDMDWVEANDYYINHIRQDVRSIMINFLQEGIDLENNSNLIQWVKLLSNKEVQILEDFLIEKEMYEVIVFINDKRKGLIIP